MTIRIPLSVPYKQLGSVAFRFEPKEMKNFETLLHHHYLIRQDDPEAQSLMGFYSRQSDSFNKFITDFLSSPELLGRYLDEGKEFVIQVRRTDEKLSDFIIREVKGVLMSCDNNLGALKLGERAIVTLVYDQLNVVFENELEIQGYMKSLIDTCITHKALDAEQLSSCCPKFVKRNMPELSPRAPRPGRR